MEFFKLIYKVSTYNIGEVKKVFQFGKQLGTRPVEETGSDYIDNNNTNRFLLPSGNHNHRPLHLVITALPFPLDSIWCTRKLITARNAASFARFNRTGQGFDYWPI